MVKPRASPDVERRSGEVEDEDLGRLGRADDELALVAHRRAVALMHRRAVQVDAAGSDLYPGMAAGTEVVLDAPTGAEPPGEQRRVLVHAQRAVARLGRGHDPQVSPG